MPGAKINKIEIQGFRAFGREPQPLVFESGLAVVWGPNSQGKTSLAEAFEFLLTGTIARRQLLASTQDEFAGSLRNVHLPPETPVFVSADVEGVDGKAHTVKRTLLSDFGRREDCRSSLEIDGSPASESDLTNLGIVLSQPPLRAPILAQHSLGYLFSVGPQDRASYFKVLLEVTDLDEFRGAVAGLERELAPVELLAIARFERAAEIPGAGAALGRLRSEVAGLREVEDAVGASLRSLLESNGRSTTGDLRELAGSAERLLGEVRERTFPLRLLGYRPLANWDPPPEDCWDEITKFITEREKLDKEVHRLVELFEAALEIPDVADASRSLDCPLCGAEQSLTPERVALIKERLASNDSFTRARAEAQKAIELVEGAAQLLSQSARGAGPEVLATGLQAARRAGFGLIRVRELLGEQHAGLFVPWLSALRDLARARRTALRGAARASSEASTARKSLAELPSIDSVKALLAEAHPARVHLQEALDSYTLAEGMVLTAMRTAVDSGSQTAGWSDLIELGRDPGALVRALAEAHAREALAAELQSALREIDRGCERVRAEKFSELSGGIAEWWNLLRPDEPTFFEGVQPRPGARRTIDLKAALSAHEDRADPQRRDAVAVFSQSQLHCLGLSMFLARAVREGCGLVVLDDPVLASDEDYQTYFESAVIEQLVTLGVQLVLLTQDHRMWKNIEHRHMHHGVELFRVDGSDPSRGTLVIKTSDDLAEMIARAELLRSGAPDVIRQKAAQIRSATERLCKEILVAEERKSGHIGAAIGDFDGKDLSYLEARVSPYLTKQSNHAGRLQAIARDTNRGPHDDRVPTQAALKVAGDLKELVREYRPRSGRGLS